MGLFSRMIEKRIAAFQNDMIARHYDEVQNIYNQMRGWRHDYHNHIQMMKAHISLGRVDELETYLNELDADLTSIDTVIKTGNIMLDAILNSKLSLATARDIQVNAKAAAPQNIAVADIDLCVIVGNLLDNAMEACAPLDSADRFIRVYIGLFKGQFYISVSNSSGGEVRKTGNRYLSTKTSGSHGFGLARVDRVVAKYSGFVNRQHEEGVFATEVMLPIAVPSA
jgi:sensor histidine kinase regulating citrate/malate metabolism